MAEVAHLHSPLVIHLLKAELEARQPRRVVGADGIAIADAGARPPDDDAAIAADLLPQQRQPSVIHPVEVREVEHAVVGEIVARQVVPQVDAIGHPAAADALFLLPHDGLVHHVAAAVRLQAGLLIKDHGDAGHGGMRPVHRRFQHLYLPRHHVVHGRIAVVVGVMVGQVVHESAGERGGEVAPGDGGELLQIAHHAAVMHPAGIGADVLLHEEELVRAQAGAVGDALRLKDTAGAAHLIVIGRADTVNRGQLQQLGHIHVAGAGGGFRIDDRPGLLHAEEAVVRPALHGQFQRVVQLQAVRAAGFARGVRLPGEQVGVEFFLQQEPVAQRAVPALVLPVKQLRHLAARAVEPVRRHADRLQRQPVVAVGPAQLRVIAVAFRQEAPPARHHQVAVVIQPAAAERAMRTFAQVIVDEAQTAMSPRARQAEADIGGAVVSGELFVQVGGQRRVALAFAVLQHHALLRVQVIPALRRTRLEANDDIGIGPLLQHEGRPLVQLLQREVLGLVKDGVALPEIVLRELLLPALRHAHQIDVEIVPGEAAHAFAPHRVKIGPAHRRRRIHRQVARHAVNADEGAPVDAGELNGAEHERLRWESDSISSNQ
ncbi:MAG: hypothetical protein BWY76_01269 [bacterium ADurb.Bin429]|nr:MAG: hypothetical protein BWY76_01269 [bacterium ADurb.Bin429]